MRNKVDFIIDEAFRAENFNVLWNFNILENITDMVALVNYIRRRTELRDNDEVNKRDREVHQYKWYDYFCSFNIDNMGWGSSSSWWEGEREDK
jgi:hypothetical protein